MAKEPTIPTLVPPRAAADSNLDLWNAVSTTDPSFTKNFKRGGGFSGTAINPTYLIRKATEIWGPMGGRWKVIPVYTNLVKGHPVMNSKEEVIGWVRIHQCCVKITYPTGPGGDAPDGEVFGFGQTEMVGLRAGRDGKPDSWYTDEEAPKKSYTDAIGKALSHLGFSADVHLGLYDDNKYVEDLRAVSPGRTAAAKPKKSDATATLLALAEKAATPDDLRAMAEVFNTLPMTDQAAVRGACADARRRVEGGKNNGA